MHGVPPLAGPMSSLRAFIKFACRDEIQILKRKGYRDKRAAAGDVDHIILFRPCRLRSVTKGERKYSPDPTPDHGIFPSLAVEASKSSSSG